MSRLRGHGQSLSGYRKFEPDTIIFYSDSLTHNVDQKNSLVNQFVDNAVVRIGAIVEHHLEWPLIGSILPLNILHVLTG